jgi:exopolysaccharide production protein ExoQ
MLASSPSASMATRSPRLAALRRLFRPAERAYVVATFLVVSGAFLPMLGRTAEEETEGSSALAHAVLLPLYAVMGWIILTHPRGFLRVAARGLPVFLLAGLAIFSTLWSAEPDLTLWRGIGLLAPTTFGIVLAQRFTTEELMRLVAWALGIGAVMSTIVALGMPDIGISTIEYGSAWQGVYGTKNGLGKAMSLGVVLFVLLAMDTQRGRWMMWLAAGLCAALVILSRSASGLVVAGGVLALIPLFRSLRFRAPAIVGVWTMAILLGGILLTIVIANAEPVFAALGRDITLTGRTDLWVIVVANIAERPWLGHGYNAFWLGWSGSSASVFGALGWEPPHSHNGLLDLWLDLGLLGVTIFLAGFALAARNAFRCARITRTIAGLWPLAFLSFMVLANSSESHILRQHNYLWILYVAVLCSDLLAQPRALGSGRQIAGDPSPLSTEAWRRTAGAIGTRASIGVRRLYRPKGRG